MKNEERVRNFRAWKALVGINPKKYRCRFVNHRSGIVAVLEERVFAYRHKKISTIWVSGLRKWGWSVIDRFPPWTEEEPAHTKQVV